ncbi:uncharacterized protein LOC107262803 [Cephus cinctus]|uniref:Uncharacterized protein LOC107262803 n=1 Tax=Cephus cinctus TaxID=211228 RepID=A0AAJ7R869_CEPCN|nr:uncharacterized protein LOC107262803 [Cephus cinctus]XP_024936058.1 uncharacterized protein LOC107262803 [Cephus cinctus]
MADAATPKRHMKFPYTFTAKMVQFPYKYYINNCWPYKYYLISVLLVSPLFVKITSAVNSPANKAKWYEIRKKELEPHH